MLAAILAVSTGLIAASYIAAEIMEKKVRAGPLEFEEHSPGMVYVKLGLYNPTSEEKECSLEAHVLDETYEEKVNISPKAVKEHKMLVEMPQGRTDVRVEYVCR